jgi:hypothetical protein
MATAFEDVEQYWAKEDNRKIALEFVRQVDTATTPAQKAAIGSRIRGDRFLKAIFDFMTYYDLKKREGSLTKAEETALKSMEGWQPAIAMKWGEGVSKAMKRGGRRRKTRRGRKLSRRKSNGRRL